MAKKKKTSFEILMENFNAALKATLPPNKKKLEDKKEEKKD